MPCFATACLSLSTLRPCLANHATPCLALPTSRSCSRPSRSIGLPCLCLSADRSTMPLRSPGYQSSAVACHISAFPLLFCTLQKHRLSKALLCFCGAALIFAVAGLISARLLQITARLRRRASKRGKAPLLLRTHGSAMWFWLWLRSNCPGHEDRSDSTRRRRFRMSGPGAGFRIPYKAG